MDIFHINCKITLFRPMNRRILTKVVCIYLHYDLHKSDDDIHIFTSELISFFKMFHYHVQ